MMPAIRTTVHPAICVMMHVFVLGISLEGAEGSWGHEEMERRETLQLSKCVCTVTQSGGVVSHASSMWVGGPVGRYLTYDFQVSMDSVDLCLCGRLQGPTRIKSQVGSSSHRATVGHTRASLKTICHPPRPRVPDPRTPHKTEARGFGG